MQGKIHECCKNSLMYELSKKEKMLTQHHTEKMHYNGMFSLYCDITMFIILVVGTKYEHMIRVVGIQYVALNTVPTHYHLLPHPSFLQPLHGFPCSLIFSIWKCENLTKILCIRSGVKYALNNSPFWGHHFRMHCFKRL